MQTTDANMDRVRELVSWWSARRDREIIFGAATDTKFFADINRVARFRFSCKLSSWRILEMMDKAIGE